MVPGDGMVKTVWIGNARFPFGPQSKISSEEAKALAAKARKRRKALKAVLRSTSKGKATTEKQKLYYGSTLVRLDALVQAAKRLEYGKRQEIADYQQMAEALKLHAKIDEPARVHLKEKSSGGYRYFCNFGVRHRAAQAIVADMVKAQFKPMPCQYGVGGKGVREAVKRVRKFHAQGLKPMVHLDITRFFDSFDHDAIITALPVPKAITEHVAIGRHHTLQPAKNYGGNPLDNIQSEYLSLIGQRGLPQGSACSPVITSFFMSKVLPPMPNGAAVLNYADDFLIVAQSPERGEKAKNALTASIEAMPLGSFKLSEKSGSFSQSGVEFLGHSFSEDENGVLHVTATPANVNKAVLHLSEEFERIADLSVKSKAKPNAKGWLPYVLVDEVVRYAVYVLSWLRTFEQADDIKEYHAEFLEYVANLACEVDVDYEKVMGLAKQQKIEDIDYFYSD